MGENGIQRVLIERVGNKSLQKITKERDSSYKSRAQRGESWPFHKMRSMDSTGEKHIVLCIHFQYPAPTAARRPPEVLTAPSIPGVGQLHTCPFLGSSSYCLMLPLPFPTYLHFLHYAQIALTLGYWVPWKYRKGSFQSKSPFTAQPSTSAPPGNRMWILG